MSEFLFPVSLPGRENRADMLLLFLTFRLAIFAGLIISGHHISK